MENTRQKKISKVLQKDIVEIIQEKMKIQGAKGVLVSVTKVDVSADFSSAKVFLSVFPSAMSQQILKEVSSAAGSIKHHVSQKAKNQLRKVPGFVFYIDDSLDYIDRIETSLKGLDNPIKKQSQ